jgi:hypothetical protein
LPRSRSRDVQLQWVHFWGANHIIHVIGPRGAGGGSIVRFREKLRPGRVEPVNLILYHPGRNQPDIGADLERQGISPRAARSPRQRN